MNQAEYTRRLDAANRDPRLMIEAQGEYTAGLIVTIQTEVIQLRATVVALRAEIARLTGLLEAHLGIPGTEKAINHGAPQ